MNSKAQQLLDDSLSRLAELVDERAASEEIQRFLAVCSRFHRYSWCNALLIMTQRRDATKVAGYRTWQSLGRQVRQGEHGILIFVPYVKKLKDQDTGDEQEKLLGFGTGYVWDISQTDGDPLPTVETLAKGDSHQELYQKLRTFASAQDITVEETEHSGSAKGSSRGGSVTVQSSESANGKAAILVLALANEVLYRKQFIGDLDRRIREIQAEAAAFVVSSHFGLDYPGAASHLAVWVCELDIFKRRLERIRNASAFIIDGLNGHQPQDFCAPAQELTTRNVKGGESDEAGADM